MEQAIHKPLQRQSPFVTEEVMKQLYRYFECEVEIPRIRHGERQTLDTLISEEALLLAKFLRNEKKEWTPRTVILN